MRFTNPPDMPPDVRINARLTGPDAERFAQLLEREGRSASELLRAALREYHARHMPRGPDPAEVLARHGFVGGGEGPADLSTRYKDYLDEALEAKHRWRVQEP